MAENLAGERILITSGPTRAPIDAVRYVSNRSTGRLGCRIAAEALRRGAGVTLVTGPDSAVPGPGGLCADEAARLRVIHVETVADLVAALRAELSGPAPPDAVVHAMAVLDYAPEPVEGKTPSGRSEWTLRMRPTPKVIGMIRRWAPDALLVGFKLEAGLDDGALAEAALASLRANRADLVVANDLARITAEAHPALILDAAGRLLARPGTKARVAAALCDLLTERL